MARRNPDGTMIKAKLATALAAFALFAAPGAALAQGQKDDTPPVAFGDNADNPEKDAAPAAIRTYAPINYDAAVDPENVWVIDLSNGPTGHRAMSSGSRPSPAQAFMTGWCSTA